MVQDARKEISCSFEGSWSAIFRCSPIVGQNMNDDDVVGVMIVCDDLSKSVFQLVCCVLGDGVF